MLKALLHQEGVMMVDGMMMIMEKVVVAAVVATATTTGISIAYSGIPGKTNREFPCGLV